MRSRVKVGKQILVLCHVLIFIFCFDNEQIKVKLFPPPIKVWGDIVFGVDPLYVSINLFKGFLCK